MNIKIGIYKFRLKIINLKKNKKELKFANKFFKYLLFILIIKIRNIE